MTRYLVVAALLLFGLASDQLPAEDRLPPVLRVGMDTRAPPWSYVPGLDYAGEDPARDPVLTEAQLQKVEGLEVDVARALGRRLSLPVKIVPVSWFDLERGLVAGRYDLILNAWTPNRQTPAAVTASEPYYRWGLLVALPATDSSVKSYRDLEGRIVGCFHSVIIDLTLQSIKARELRPYDVQEKLFEDLKAGKLDAVVYDSPMFVGWPHGRSGCARRGSL
jgi:polar amino acid transport system substrate-binding protein